MEKQTIFTGSAVAVITPFRNGKIDYKSFADIIEFQIKNKTHAIVVCGTTGESSTLTDDEHRECIEFVINQVNGRVPVIAGTGSNDTAYAVDLSKHACEAGADGLLLVTPYYNKTNPKGMIRNFLTIAESVDKPIILYNVPTRTSCNITTAVFKELAKHENIVAVKEASGNIHDVLEMMSECGDSLDLYSGNDDQIVPLLSVGSKGVISVIANIMPAETHDICQLWFDGKIKESADLQLKLFDLVNKLFIEVNPIPVKTAMSLMGFCSDELRLPLYEMDESNKEKLIISMKNYGLL